MNDFKIAVSYSDQLVKKPAERLAAELKLDLVDFEQSFQYSALLVMTPQRLELALTSQHDLGSIYVDFLSAASLHRYLHGGGRQQMLARAVGLHKKSHLTVYDMSAGLGKDAFVLAALGAQLTMIERSPIIAALLHDGWRRAQAIGWIQALSWRFIQADSHAYLTQLTASEFPQVIYFDPMFPERKKSALVKKDMRILRLIAGEDSDAAQLLALALKTATERVVVKRPRLAEAIPGATPSFTLEGQSSRFDIYLTRKPVFRVCPPLAHCP